MQERTVGLKAPSHQSTFTSLWDFKTDEVNTNDWKCTGIRINHETCCGFLIGLGMFFVAAFFSLVGLGPLAVTFYSRPDRLGMTDASLRCQNSTADPWCDIVDQTDYINLARTNYVPSSGGSALAYITPGFMLCLILYAIAMD
jgi:hypothetical protein